MNGLMSENDNGRMAGDQNDRIIRNLLLVYLRQIIFVDTINSTVDQQVESFKKWEQALQTLDLPNFQRDTKRGGN